MTSETPTSETPTMTATVVICIGYAGLAAVHRLSRLASADSKRSAIVLYLPCRASAVRRFPADCMRLVVILRVMPTSLSISVEQSSAATPASVYDVLMDLDRWSDFMPGVSAASWERRGAPDTGVGGIRRMRLVLGVTRDHIVDGTRPHHHAYAAAFPWYVPLKDYRGDIRIEDRPNGPSSYGQYPARLESRA
jgi:hypothetical protein